MNFIICTVYELSILVILIDNIDINYIAVLRPKNGTEWSHLLPVKYTILGRANNLQPSHHINLININICIMLRYLLAIVHCR